jgi:hypothetical protein
MMKQRWVALVASLLASLLASACTLPTEGAGGDAGAGLSGGGGAGEGGWNFGGLGGGRRGCEHVDLVFAVDDSVSMQEEAAALRDVVFPAFASTLGAIESVRDFRAAVLDACPSPANFHTRGVAGECHFSSGRPWIESRSGGDVRAELSCAGEIWSGDALCNGDDDDEQPASAAAAALAPPWSNGPNAGFSRDDALLVVVALTDEDEQPVPAAEMPALRDRIVASKGAAEHVVFLGIGGSHACEGVYGHAERAERLQALVGAFEAAGYGFFWDLCAGGLEQGLAAALGTVETACRRFQPIL